MDNVAMPSPIVRGFARPSGARLPELPLYLILLSVAGCWGVAAVAGPSKLDMPLRLALVVLLGLASIAAVYWKAAILPIAAYFVAVPFDNMSQTGVGTITRMLATASIVVVLLVMAIDKRRRGSAPLPAVAGWLAFIVWAVLSLTWSVDVRQSWNWTTQISELFGLFAIFAMFRIRPDEARLMAWAIVVGGVASALFGLWLYHTGTFVQSNGFDPTRLDINYGAQGSINPDHFAGALVLPIALALPMTLRMRGAKQFLGWAALLLCFLGVFVSATRSAVVAIALMIVYLVIFARRGRPQLLAMTAAGFLASLAMPSVWRRFADPTQANASGRFDVWNIGWRAFRDHWLVGSGAGDFRAAYTAAYFETHAPLAPVIQDAHNMLVSTSVELGVVGVAILLAAWIFQFRTVASIDRASPLSDLRLGAEAGLIGLCFTALTVDVLYFKYLWIGFMITVMIRNAAVTQRKSAVVRAPA